MLDSRSLGMGLSRGRGGGRLAKAPRAGAQKPQPSLGFTEHPLSRSGPPSETEFEMCFVWFPEPSPPLIS